MVMTPKTISCHTHIHENKSMVDPVSNSQAQISTRDAINHHTRSLDGLSQY